jgi:dipeptidyl aminopeptidase/acylaminoacyl peptidase
MRLVCLLASAHCLALLVAPGAAQVCEPGFDAAPVMIAHVVPASKRMVTSLDLLSLRQVYGLSVSPNGIRVAYVIGQADYDTDRYRSALFVADTVAAKIPKCLGSAGTPHWDAIHQWIPEAPQWSGDSESFTYRMRMQNTDFWQVWSWDSRSSRLSQLTHVPGDVIRYRRNEAAGEFILTVKLPLNSEKREMLVREGIHYDERFLPWQGIPVLLADLQEQSRVTATWVHIIATGEERIATSEEEKMAVPSLEELERLVDGHQPGRSDVCKVERPLVSPDGQTVAFVCFSENVGGTGVFGWNLFTADVASHEVRSVTAGSYLVTDFWWSGDGRALFYVAAEGDGRSNTIRSLDLRTFATKIVYSGDAFLKQFSADHSGRLIACTRETNVAPAVIVLLDLTQSKMWTLVDLNPEFMNIQLSGPERIAGVNRYGEEWFGHVVKPLDYHPGQRYPLIITTYRSGDYFLLGASGNENPIQLYAAHGFVVLSFDIGRLRRRREHDFADRLLDWESPTESMVQAIELLVDGGLVDRDRIGISGFSHGAEIVEYAISQRPLFRAAVLSGPAARDPYFYYMAGAAWQESFEKWGLGGWPEGAARSNWKEVAASLNADRIQTPLLVNASDSEYIANLSLITSLQQLQRPVDLFVYPDELHVKNWPRHRYKIYERNLDWYRFWLKGEEDPAPSKSQQYKHWRELREDSGRKAPGAIER